MASAGKASEAPGGALRRRERVALVLHGGDALGAYQAGAYEALSHTVYRPSWVVGISVGAINAALIAGNPAERRVERLSEFWQLASAAIPLWPPARSAVAWLQAASNTIETRASFNQLSAMWSAGLGLRGCAAGLCPLPQAATADGAVQPAIHSSAPLRAALERLVDFELINSRKVRLTLGTVDEVSGRATYFDNFASRIRPEHVLASAALPAAGTSCPLAGTVCRDPSDQAPWQDPLQHLLDCRGRQSLLVFQVDLLGAPRQGPAADADACARAPESLQFRADAGRNSPAEEIAHARRAARGLIAQLHENLRGSAAMGSVAEAMRMPATDLVQLSYRTGSHERDSTGQDFSPAEVQAHWKAGRG